MIGTETDNSTPHRACSFSAFARHRKTGNVSYLRLRCMCWSCCKCSKRLKKAWGNHFASQFDTESQGLWRSVIKPEQWGAVYSRIHRLGGEYTKIRSSAGYVVFSTIALDNSEHLCRHDATAKIRRDINDIPLGRRGVSTSRKWKLQPVTKSTHELISTSQANRFAVEKAAADIRRERRVFSEEEFRRFLTSTMSGETINGISGPDRAMLYTVAAFTGYRASELSSLTAKSIDFISDPPVVKVTDAYSKNKNKHPASSS